MCLNQVDHVFNHPWLKKIKKGFFLQKEASNQKREIMCLNQVDHVFKPGRSCV